MDAGTVFDTFAPMACCAFGGAANAIITTHAVLFVIGVGLKVYDMVTDVQVIVKNSDLMNTYQAALTADSNYTDHPNRTYCYNSTFWQQSGDKVQETVDLFGTLITASWAVFVLAVVLQTLFIIGTIFVLVSTRNPEDGQTRDKAMKALAMVQLFFTLIEDIPQNTMAIEFSWLAGGKDGLDCWTCAHNANCTDVEPLSLSSDQELFISLLVSFISGVWDMATSPMTLVFLSQLILLCMGKSDDDDDSDLCDRIKVRLVIGIGGVIGAIKMHCTNFALLHYHLIPESGLSTTFRDAMYGMFILSCVINGVELLFQVAVTIIKGQEKSGACAACYAGCCTVIFTAGIQAGAIALAVLAPKVSWIFLIVAAVLYAVVVLCMLCCCVCLGACGGLSKIGDLDDD